MAPAALPGRRLALLAHSEVFARTRLRTNKTKQKRIHALDLRAHWWHFQTCLPATECNCRWGQVHARPKGGANLPNNDIKTKNKTKKSGMTAVFAHWEAKPQRKKITFLCNYPTFLETRPQKVDSLFHYFFFPTHELQVPSAIGMILRLSLR